MNADDADLELFEDLASAMNLELGKILRRGINISNFAFFAPFAFFAVNPDLTEELLNASNHGEDQS